MDLSPPNLLVTEHFNFAGTAETDGLELMSSGLLPVPVSSGIATTTSPTRTGNISTSPLFRSRRAPSRRLRSPPAANTLPLTDSTTSFTRSATVMGTNATLALNSFSFSKADRGRVERVDLLVNLPGVLPPTNQDTDGDGVPDWAELVAGTDPSNPNSVFKASTAIQPAPGGGLIIKWSSVAGKTYSIHRTTNLGLSFAALATNLPATAPQNQYTDAAATNAGPYFYRIQVNP
jgi:hypothetical protein